MRRGVVHPNSVLLSACPGSQRNQIQALLWKHGIKSELELRIKSCAMKVSITIMSEDEAIHFFIRLLQAGEEIVANVVSAVLGVSFVR